MAELLISQVDKINEDVRLNPLLFKRGDVIVACPNNWNWSQEELTNPDWRILKLTSVGVAQIAQFLQPEVDNSTGLRTLLKKRLHYLDVDAAALPQAFKNWWRDDTRAVPIFTVNLTSAQLLSFLKVRNSTIKVL